MFSYVIYVHKLTSFFIVFQKKIFLFMYMPDNKMYFIKKPGR